MPRPIVQEITALDKTQKAFRSINRSIGGMKTAFAGLTAALGVGSLGALVKSSIDAADNMAKLSDRLGISTEALSQLQFVAERSGVSFEKLTMGLQRMQRRVSEAAQGTGEAKNALRELGLDAQRLTQLDLDKQFEVVADAILKVGSAGDKTRLAMKLFDSEGVALLQTMTEGAAGIRELREEADALGLTLEQDTARQAERVTDSFTRLRALGTALGVTLIDVLGPAIEATVNWLSDAIPRAAGIAAKSFLVVKREILRSASAISSGLSGFYDALAEGAEFIGADFLTRAYSNAAKSTQEFADDTKAAFTEIQNMNLGLEEARVRLETAASIQGVYNRSITETFLKEKELAGTAKARSAALREQNKALAEAARAEQEWQDKLQSVIDQVDPTAPLKRQLAELEKLAEKFPQYADLIGEAMLDIQDRMDGIGQSVDENNTKMEQGKDLAKDFGATFSSAFEDAIISGKGLSEILKGLEKDIIRIVTRELVTNPIASTVSGLFGAGGGFDLSKLFGGFRASGGPVMAGTPYVVGEMGPEIVIPKSNSTVIPNGQLGGVVNVYVNAPAGASPEAYRQSARQGAIEGSRLLQRGNGIR